MEPKFKLSLSDTIYTNIIAIQMFSGVVKITYELISKLPKSRTYVSTDISFVQAYGNGGRSLLTK